MYIERLTISFATTYYRRDDDKLVFRDEIPHASFLGRGLVSRVCLNVKFEHRGRWKSNK